MDTADGGHRQCNANGSAIVTPVQATRKKAQMITPTAASQKGKTHTRWYCVEPQIWHKCVCETDRLTDRENRLAVAKGKKDGKGKRGTCD